jgi:uncharacterized protein DUF4349/putative zinc finger protein
MNTTAHPVAPEEVMAFLDGELSAAEAQTVSAHVDHCAECRTLTEQLRGMSLSLSRWNVEAVPAKLENTIRNAAAKTGSGVKISKPGLFVRASFWSWKGWAAGLGAVAAVLLLVVGIATPNLRRDRAATRIDTFLAQPGDYRSQSENSDKLSAGKPRVTAKLSEPVTLSKPGIAADSNGLFHGLGDLAAKSFSTDGQPLTDQQSKVASGPMIARTVSLSIMVKDFAASRSSLDTILARHHGYSAQLNVSTPENAPRGLQASLRIPAPELAATLAEIRTLGRVENEAQSGEEVTQQHTDLVARLKNSRETEERLRNILEQRTGKVGEVLQVEREIARVRGDIEGMEAEQQALEHRVDFASVELQLSEEFKAQLNPPAPSVSTRIHNALVAGYRDAEETLLGIVLFFAEYSPTLLIWLAVLAVPAIFLWRRYRKALATA